MQFSDDFLNKYGAPGLAGLTACDAPSLDVIPALHIVFSLNDVLSPKYSEPARRYALMFIRRVEHSAREYQVGRDLVLKYVDGLPDQKKFPLALLGLIHFEQCIGSLALAMALFKRLVQASSATSKSSRWGKREDTIWRICQRTKHFDQDVAKAPHDNLDLTAPVWLTNHEICSIDGNISFVDLHLTLTEALDRCKELAEEIPRDMVEVYQQRQSKEDAT